jgi:hypothetical protein
MCLVINVITSFSLEFACSEAFFTSPNARLNDFSVQFVQEVTRFGELSDVTVIFRERSYPKNFESNIFDIFMIDNFKTFYSEGP